MCTATGHSQGTLFRLQWSTLGDYKIQVAPKIVTFLMQLGFRAWVTLLECTPGCQGNDRHLPKSVMATDANGPL